MGKLLRRIAVALGVVAALTSEAQALGPFCFQLTPYPNVVVWFLDAAGGNQYSGSGRDLQENAAQVVSGFVTGPTFVATFATAAGSTAGSVPYVASAEINLTTVAGPGRFTNLRPDGSTTGTFTLTNVVCPAAALAAAEREGPGAQAGVSPFGRPTPAARPLGDERRVSKAGGVAP